LDATHVKSALKTHGPLPAEQYLTFQLAGQDYGIEILRVQEIKCWEKPTRLPHAPEHVQGVINLRGAVVPILDLRQRFNLHESHETSTAVVIVVKTDSPRAGLTAGIVVDAVCEVRSIESADLQPPPDLGAAFDSGFVRGLVMVEERMLILLDLATLIADMLGEIAAAPKVA
jgi:purine-binding chemotaxis protein CheW